MRCVCVWLCCFLVVASALPRLMFAPGWNLVNVRCCGGPGASLRRQLVFARAQVARQDVMETGSSENLTMVQVRCVLRAVPAARAARARGVGCAAGRRAGGAHADSRGRVDCAALDRGAHGDARARARGCVVCASLPVACPDARAAGVEANVRGAFMFEGAARQRRWMCVPAARERANVVCQRHVVGDVAQVFFVV